MSVIMHGKTLSATSVELVHQPSGSRITTTAPKDNGGDGSSFSPTDLCAASLGACASTIMTMFAARNGIQLEGISFTVEKQMQAAPRKIARLAVRYVLNTRCSAEEFARLENAGRTCPVRLTLDGSEVTVEETYQRA